MAETIWQLMMHTHHKIHYRPRWGSIIGGALFFGLGALILGWKASTNDQGRILNGIFHFSPEGATVFYWVLTVASAPFVVAAALLTALRIGTVHFLELTLDSLVIPHGFLQTKTTRLLYSEIIAVSEIEISGQKFFCVHTASRKYSVNASFLPAKDDYEKVKCFLAEKAVVNVSASLDRCGQASG